MFGSVLPPGRRDATVTATATDTAKSCCKPKPSKPSFSGSRRAFTANCSIRSISREITGLSDEELREDIRRLAEGMLHTRVAKLPAIDEDRLVDELIAESFGLGPLEPYMQDPDVTDILVNGPHEVYVERLGRLQETNTVFADEEHLLQIIQRVVARVGRRIDEHSPMVDARLPDGCRVNAIIPPLALRRPGAVDSPLRPPAAAGRRPLGPRLGLPGNAASCSKRPSKAGSTS